MLTRPMLKPGVRPLWRDQTTLQLGVDPRRAVVLTGLSMADRDLFALLDGTRDLSELAAWAQRLGLPPGRVGLLVAAFGGCVLLGSFLAPLVSRVLSVRAVLLLELWTWLGCGLFLIWPNVYVLTAGTLPTAMAIPSTNSVVHGYRMAMTPDRLLGRVESIWRTISLMIMPLGPLVAGVLLDAVPARAAIGVFAAVALVLVAWGSLSPAIRAAPSLDELDLHRA